jgi:cytochrome c biogenesis protein CcmG, thiol:disulfide interchange protein DsbE
MSKRNALKFLVLAAILGVAVYAALRQRSSRPLVIGDSAPDFAVPAVPTGFLQLKDYRGRVVVLNLWATWCPPCVEETPSLEQFAERMRGQSVTVVSVSVDDDLKALQNFIRQYHISYPVGRDPDRSLAARFGTWQFPETYIFDRRGILADKVIGSTDWTDPRMQNFVLDLARGTNQ